MKIRFTTVPPGRDYKVGQVEDFLGPVAETYARKYIERGWAVDLAEEPRIIEPKPEPRPEAVKPSDVRSMPFSLKKPGK